MTSARALLIGVDHYDDEFFHDFECCEEDASIVFAHYATFSARDQLSAKVLKSPERRDLTDALQWLYEDRVADLRILYLSGHGYRSLLGNCYFAMKNSSVNYPETMLDGQQLVEMAVSAGPSSQHLWIFDFCYAEGLMANTVDRTIDLTFLAGVSSNLATPANRVTESNLGSSLAHRSAFTRSLLLALHGMCPASGRQNAIGASVASDLAVMESIRLRRPTPVFIRRGIGGGPSLPLPAPPDSRPGPAAPILIQNRVSTAVPRVVVGTDGIRSLSVALQSTGATHVGVMDGRSGMQLSMSSRLQAVKSTGRGAVIDGVLEDEVLLDGLALLQHSESGAIVAASDLLIPEIEDISVISTPPISESEGMGWISRNRDGIGLSRDLDGEAVEALLDESGDSLEIFGALVALAASGLVDPADYAKKESRATLDELDLNDSQITVLGILSAAPGVFFPRSVMIDFLVEHRGFNRPEVNLAVDSLARLRLLDLSAVWMRVVAPIASMLSVSTRLTGENAASGLARLSVMRTTGMQRFQLLRAAASISSKAVRSLEIGQPIVEMLGTIGSDLMLAAGARSFEKLVAQVRELRSGDVPAALLIHHGHALRLSDRYDDAAEAFRDSLTRADTLSGRVGRVAALKNSTARRDELLALHGSFSASGLESQLQAYDTAARRELANSLFQQANVIFSTSAWNDASDSYKAAIELLDESVPEHQSLIIDVMKGQGDVALRRGDLSLASDLATSMLDVCASSYLVQLDPKTYAKTVQYVGDCERRASVVGESIDARRLIAARYWLEGAVLAYRENELRLGELMSNFKLAQCQSLAGEHIQAATRHAEIMLEMDALGNRLWQYRSAVAGALEYAWAGIPQVGLFDQLLTLVRDRIAEGKLSPYHHAWGELTIGVVNSSWTGDAVQSFEEIGAADLVLRLRTEGPGVWLGGYY